MKLDNTYSMTKRLLSGIALATFVQFPAHAVLIHHWTFDEGTGDSAADSAGSNNASLFDGASLSTSLWGAAGTGALGSASYLNLDGNNDFANPTLTLPQWTSSNAETWAVWILNSGSNNNDIIVGNRLDGVATGTVGTTNQRLFAKITPRPSNSGRFAYNDGAGTSVDFDGQTPGYSDGYPGDTWVHLAVVRDGFDFTFYVDGDLVNSTPIDITAGSSAAPSAGLPFFIGGEIGEGDDEFFGGGIDDVRIYSTALSQSEVQALIPEPSSIALLGLGSLTLLRRRRR